jgi:hypothetical protein
VSLWRSCCCGPVACPSWFACLPPEATITVRIRQEYRTIDDGDYATPTFEEIEDVVIQGAKLDLNNLSQIPCSIGGPGNGTFTWDYTFRSYSYPLLTPYIGAGNCPPCKQRQLCKEVTGYYQGDVQYLCIDCFDPCATCLPQPECFPFPTNRLQAEHFFEADWTDENYNECLTINGPGAGAYAAPAQHIFRMLGRPGCFKEDTFDLRTFEYGTCQMNWSAIRTAVVNEGICTGRYPTYYECDLSSFPYRPSYDHNTGHDVRTCSWDECVDNHLCRNTIGGPVTKECGCVNPDTGTPCRNGSGGLNLDGCAKRLLQHVVLHSVSVTIP